VLFGGIWVTHDNPATAAGLVESLVNYLVQQDWCGPLFTRDGAGGTLTLKQIGLDHPRAPSIALAMRADDAANCYGIIGTTRHDAPYPVGGGCHGGLSRHELHNFLCMGGRAFKQGFAPEVPAGNIDITPTVCRVLGIDGTGSFDGRVLEEALSVTQNDLSGTLQDRVCVSTNTVGVKTHLSVATYQGANYLNCAWVE